MAKPVCGSRYSYDHEYITTINDAGLLYAIRLHAKPEFWTSSEGMPEEQASLRRWGSYLRREARRRGLL